MKRNFLRISAATAAAGLTAAGLAGCSAGAEDNTFTILQYETTTTAQYQGWQKALEIFKAEHPDVNVEFSTTSFDSIRSNAKILLTGDEVPDVMLVNTGNADAGQLAAQGLLDPLTTVVEEQGWDDEVTGSVATLAMYDEKRSRRRGRLVRRPQHGLVLRPVLQRGYARGAGLRRSPDDDRRTREHVPDVHGCRHHPGFEQRR